MMANTWPLLTIILDNQKNRKVSLKKKVPSSIYSEVNKDQEAWFPIKKIMPITKNTLKSNAPVFMKVIELIQMLMVNF